MYTYNNMKITPVLLAGGSGTRLWPLSRKNFPKQFIKVNTESNLFQNTLQRIENEELFNPPIIICGKDHRWQIEDSLKKLKINKYSPWPIKMSNDLAKVEFVLGCPKYSKHSIFDLIWTFRILRIQDLNIFELWISVFASIRFELRIFRISRIYLTLWLGLIFEWDWAELAVLISW